MTKMGCLLFVKGLKNVHVIPDTVDVKWLKSLLMRIITLTTVFSFHLSRFSCLSSTMSLMIQNQSKVPRPQWRERFTLNYFLDSLHILEVELWLKEGRRNEESLGTWVSIPQLLLKGLSASSRKSFFFFKGTTSLTTRRECFHHHRCGVDLSTVPTNQRQLFTLTLNPGRGVLVFLLAVNTCSGVSIAELSAAPLDQPHERQNQLENYVSTSITCLLASARVRQDS